jgi:hypothetical protein
MGSSVDSKCFAEHIIADAGTGTFDDSSTDAHGE